MPELRDPAAALFAEASQSVVGAEGIVSTLGAEVFNASRLRLPLGHLTLSPMMVANDPSRRRHLARAVVEGLAYAAKANIELLQKAAQNGSIEAIRLAGGMSKSGFFAQILADVLGMPVEAAAGAGVLRAWRCNLRRGRSGPLQQPGRRSQAFWW